jgi:DNA polymerase III subunit epsilon
MNIIFFDLETTGLPKNWKAPMHEVDNWPRCIQIAWLVTDDFANEVSRGYHLIRPDGWVMPTGDFWKQHAFDQESSLLNGKSIVEVLDLFINDINGCSTLVSHNMNFDYNVVGAEMLRAGVRSKTKLQKICTMELGAAICKIPFGKDHRPWKNKAYKWPKLSELYQNLFKRDFEGSHDAMVDVIACRDCFFELVKRGVIKVELSEAIS